MKKRQPKRLRLSTETLRQIRGGSISPWPDPPPRVGESLMTCPEKSGCWPLTVTP